MARGNLIQGQGSGKVGDIVLMVRNGQQVSRVYTTSGSRSGKEASEASRIQRVKFGSASNQWGLYRYVSTRMYRKGRSSKMSDYNYFVKKNQPLFPYLTKEENASGVHVLQPGQFSSGSLGTISLIDYRLSTVTEGRSNFVLYDSRLSLIGQCSWTSLMSAFKTSLIGAYPSARKITYLMSRAVEVTVEEGGLSYVSQSARFFPIIIDLYKEVTSGENAMTVAQYFASKISDSVLSTFIGSRTGNICGNNYLMDIFVTSDSDLAILQSMAALVFASDDVADDMYTTELPEDAINLAWGPYADWAGYRTSSALKLASDSYGYQQGVLRDEIASFGNDIDINVSAYVAKLSMVSEAASQEFLKSIGGGTTVKAKQVVKSAEEK